MNFYVPHDMVACNNLKNIDCNSIKKYFQEKHGSNRLHEQIRGSCELNIKFSIFSPFFNAICLTCDTIWLAIYKENMLLIGCIKH
jgi:hypothetical protein